MYESEAVIVRVEFSVVVHYRSTDYLYIGEYFMTDFVIKGHICYSETKTEIRIVENGYLVCVAGESKGVYRELPEEYKALPLKDYGNRLIIPGMVDLHIHAPQFGYRGMRMDLELMDWLTQYTFPEEEKYEDLVYAKKAYSLFAEEMKKSATSRAVIFATRHKEATGLLMDIMEETGLVTHVGKVNMDRGATEKLNEESAGVAAADTREWIEKSKGKYERTEAILTPRFIPSCTDELMEKLGEIQREYHMPLQSHLSESPGEIAVVKELRPQDEFYAQGYEKYGLFGSNGKTIMAHCVWCSEEERALMEKNGVYVAHCPASNTNIASGIAPIREFLTQGIRVGLGSDVAGGHSHSMFRALTDTVQASKMYWRYVNQESKPIIFEEAFFMATKGGGEYFGKVGSFEEGYEFDAIVLDEASAPFVQDLNVMQRLERAVYLLLDTNGIHAKYVRGTQLI